MEHIETSSPLQPKVLIVEDNEMNLQLLQYQLAQLGVDDVAAVANGAQALDWLALHRCDLILADCQMPVMDGFEMARRIRAQEKATGEHVRIVAVTAGVRDCERDRCFDAGMDDYVAKPVQLDALRRVLQMK